MRSISAKRYLGVFVLTLLIFSFGILIGLVLDTKKIELIQELNQNQKLDFESLQLQYLLLSELEGEEGCSALQTTLQRNLLALDKSLSQIISLRENNAVNTREYSLIERQYTLDNLNYWFFAQKASNFCGFDVVNILYFQSGEECDSCGDQGVILTYFKGLFGERLLVFPIDADLDEEPMVELLKNRYGVKKLPSIIIDDEKYEGVVKREELKKLICSNFENEQEECL